MVDCGEGPDPLRQMRAQGMLSPEAEDDFRPYLKGVPHSRRRRDEGPKQYELSPEQLRTALGWYAGELARPDLQPHLRGEYKRVLNGIYERHSGNGNAPVLEEFRPLFVNVLPQTVFP